MHVDSDPRGNPDGEAVSPSSTTRILIKFAYLGDFFIFYSSNKHLSEENTHLDQLKPPRTEKKTGNCEENRSSK